MRTHNIAIAAGQPHSFFDSFDQALSKVSPKNALLLAGFAYATFGGVRYLVSHVEASRSRSIPKRFIIGIHHGITEPYALELLRGIQQSEVRIFVPGKKLTPQALVAAPLFHPKVLALTSARTGKLKFLQAGSPNLTSSAVGDIPKNFEFAIGLGADRRTSLDSGATFTNWWKHIWNCSRIVDKRLIEQYGKVRLKVLDQNPILRHAVGPPSEVQDAKYFFMEVGAASGPPGYRHQIEFPETLAAFFGTPVRHGRTLTLSGNGVAWDKRPLSYKVTTFGVEIWRLGMPTQRSGGEPITERVIRFCRTDDPNTFEFEITDRQSETFTKWENVANTLGQLGATHGGRPRRYGFY